MLGVDYHDTFAPTARITSVRTLMQIAVQHDLVVHQLDVKTAYLNAPIDCEIFVDQPEGFEIKSSLPGKKLVCRLNKSLYGLKQSGRNWNTLLHSFLIENGFSQSSTDTCIYSYKMPLSASPLLRLVTSAVLLVTWHNLSNDSMWTPSRVACFFT